MTLAFWCVLIAGVLPFAAVSVAKWDKTYMGNNHRPRDWEAQLTGKSSRAHAAHLNSFEAFPLFAAGVIIAAFCRAPQPLLDGIAIAFVLVRVLYIWCYLSDRARMRSLVWMAGLALNVALFFVAAFGAQ
ncbi:MAG: MAPEG family protein [Betaproteobacteria bacterium]